MKRTNNTLITFFDHDRLREMLNKYSVSSKARDMVSVQRLAEEIKRAKKIDPKKIPSDFVTMNSVFELKKIGESGKFQFRLVFPNEADIGKGNISVLAPVGTAVLGYREGDIIRWEVPEGDNQYQIKKIIYQPEAAGDYHL